MRLGEKIRMIRKLKKWKLKKVASETGLSISYLSDLERGRCRPSLKTLYKIASAYNMNAYGLLINIDEV